MTQFPVKTLTMLLILALSGLLFTGCTTSPNPETHAPEPIAGYLGLQEEFGPQDFSPLRGRRIVIDPGHGGFFRGALGPKGLTEAEVNLGVALYLRGLLEWAEATVYLTRTADYDFLSPADSTLATDLAFRSSFTDSLQPDVFISIHHNSTASRDEDINETQTYYPLGDEGASLDLARSIHRHLVLNLEISPAKILPGNFHVLRNTTVPAVLGEPAMLSHPVMENRLSMAASQELEAQAYFLGLLDYFSLGQPQWLSCFPDTLTIDSSEDLPSLSWTFLPGDSLSINAPGPRPTSFELTLDGLRQDFELSADGRTVTWVPEESLKDRGLVAGPHTFALKGSNLKGRFTPIHKSILQVEALLNLVVEIFPESRGSQPGRHYVIQSTTVSGSNWDRDRILIYSPDENLKNLQVGRALQDGSPSPAPFPTPIMRPELPAPLKWKMLGKPGNQNWNSRLPRPECPVSLPALCWQPGQPLWLEAPGHLPIIHNGQLQNAAFGTINTQYSAWQAQAILPQLLGRTIVLDPAGGGTDHNGRFPLGTRGADLNLATALQAQRLLEGAGATVHLTRKAEVAPDAQQKVLLAGHHEADLFLTIGRVHEQSPEQVLHHPGSKTGILWATAMSQAMASLDSLQVGQSYGYLLRQTACPALEIRLSTPKTPESEMEMTTPAWAMAEARGILLSCATALSGTEEIPPSADPVKVLELLFSPTALPSVDWARWDGNFDWQDNPFQP
ncbi:MAG: N-acetylmuramoyl-L-alanine amidase, partial [bacterium]|nr:N-acetylmuramoyl-L-alanine amidase [bacterium]